MNEMTPKMAEAHVALDAMLNGDKSVDEFIAAVTKDGPAVYKGSTEMEVEIVQTEDDIGVKE